jgi:pimeloyl-ACP methyl ester carboxylesterase
MADDAVDAATILHHLGLGDFVTLGWSGGGPRALACAALLPRRCRAAATMAGVAPYDAPGLDWAAGMAEENVAEYAVAALGASAYHPFLRRSLPPVFESTPEQVAEALGGLVTPVDAAYATGEFAAWLSRTFARAGEQGVVGARDDGLAAVGPWGFDVEEITVPVAVWHGRQDAMVPSSHGEWLAAHVPTARAHLLEHEGHLSIWTRIEEILTDLLDLAE